jgi:hypothetical protein
MMRGLVIDMNDKALRTLAQLRAFLDGAVTVLAIRHAHDGSGATTSWT